MVLCLGGQECSLQTTASAACVYAPAGTSLLQYYGCVASWQQNIYGPCALHGHVWYLSCGSLHAVDQLSSVRPSTAHLVVLVNRAA